MADDDTPVPGESAAASAARWNLLLVALAMLALIVAAFALPPLGPSAAGAPEFPDERDPDAGDGRPQPEGGPGTPGGEGSTPADGDGRSSRQPDGGERSAANGTLDSDDGNRIVIRRGSNDTARGGNLTGGGSDRREPYPGCLLVLWDRPVPGKRATVLVWNDGGPVPDRPVRFDDRRLGQTGSTGRVDGPIPYAREFELAVRYPAVETCRFLRLDKRVGFAEWADRDGPPLVVRPAERGTELVGRNGTLSTTVDVRGEVRVNVTGDPFPGESVRVNATVDGVPMREATVSVDGEPVGETDSRGIDRLTVPDDGAEQFAVEVTRGAFTGRTTVEVLLLSLDVRPAGLLAIPGREATAVAAFGDRPAPEATVVLGDETVGTTGPDGTVDLQLPLDPRLVATAAGRGQTASAAIWPLYVPLALVGLVSAGAVAGSIAATRRRESGRSARLVAAIWTGVAVLVAGAVLDGWGGFIVAAGGLAAVVLAGAAVGYRRALRRRLIDAVRWTRATGPRLLGLALRLTDAVVRLSAWAGRRLGSLLSRLREVPRSAGALLALLWDRLRRLPRLAVAELGRFLAVLRVGGRRLARVLVTPRGLAVVGIALCLVAAGFVVADLEGAVLVAIAVFVGLLTYALRRSRDGDGAVDSSPRSDARPPAPPAATTGTGGDAADRDPSLRELWRTFARWVVPGRWRTRTPGEVARAAVEGGLPAGPVRELTEAFRAVEYGDRAASAEVRARARSAYEALRPDGGEEVEER